jgi:hypothetical protein
MMTNAMFYGMGRWSGSSSHYHPYGYNSYNNYNNYDNYDNGYGGRRRWDDDEERRWRRTTRAPYFENKAPGSEMILPAAAVLGMYCFIDHSTTFNSIDFRSICGI